jgi:H+/Na+-translocating ferredoxin:NAD+ oxidoreductase subunit D
MSLSLSPQSSVLVSPSIGVKGYYASHITAGLILLFAGLLLYGWAAPATVAVVLVAAGAATTLWRRVGPLGRQLNAPRCLWMALLLGLALPPHLVTRDNWPLVPAAGVFVVMVDWLLARVGSGRVDPMVLAYLILVILFAPRLAAHWVLKPNRIVFGSLSSADSIDAGVPRTKAWMESTFSPNGRDALYDTEPAAIALASYTSGRQQPDRYSVSAQMVLRDIMPPLDDLVIGGEPGPIGVSSAVAVIVGGLLLVHKGLIDVRVPILAVGAAAAAFLILPMPVVIGELGPQWRWMALRAGNLGWETGLTLLSYELFASPLLFVAFFLATSPRTRPTEKPARIIYALLLGGLAAPAQLYSSVTYGPYVALLLASLLSRTLDRLFGRHVPGGFGQALGGRGQALPANGGIRPV